MVGGKVIDLLEAADWGQIILDLTRYAIWEARKYTWTSGEPSILPKGNTPEDMALDAIKKVWSGQREWDPTRYPDLLVHLKWIVKSDINHLVESLEHGKTKRLDELQPDDNFAFKKSEILPKALSPSYDITPNPEENLVSSEKQKAEKELLSKLKDSVSGDDDLELLFLCLEEGIDKPSDISKEMGWDIKKVYNLKRKLARRAAQIGRSI